MDNRSREQVKLRASRSIRPSGGWQRWLQHYDNGRVVYEISKDDHNFWFRSKAECDWFCRIFYGSMTEKLYEALEQEFQRFNFKSVVEGL